MVDDIKAKLDDYKQQDHRRRDHGARPSRSRDAAPANASGPGRDAVASRAEPGRCPPRTHDGACAIATASPPAATAASRPSDRRGRAARHHQAVPRRRRQPRHRHRRAAAARCTRSSGENGAGKSTLMKILYGMQQPDEGTISVDGAAVTLPLARPTRSRAGIGMVHQHFMLADNLTVLENVVLGGEPTQRRPARLRAARARIDEISDAVRPRRRPGRAGRGPRRRRPAAGRDPQGALPRRPDPHPRRADRGAGAAGGRRAVRQPARAQGRGPDRSSSSRTSSTRCSRSPTRSPSSAGARRSRTVDPQSVTARQLAELMVGSELPSPETARVDRHRPWSCSRVEGLTVASAGRPSAARRRHASPSTRARSLGIAGVEGNGQAELVEAIMGMRPLAAGHGRARRRGRHRLADPAPPGGRHRLHPRGPAPARACCWRRRCGRTGSSATRPSAPNVTRAADRPRRRPRRTPSGSSTEYDVRTPGIDVAGRRAVRRQPAEAHRRPGDERRPGAADRRAPDPRRRRRRPGRDLGPHARGPRARAWRCC